MNNDDRWWLVILGRQPYGLSPEAETATARLCLLIGAIAGAVACKLILGAFL